MKRIILLLLITCAHLSCSTDDNSLPTPTDVSNAIAEARVGGALVKWEIPSDTNFTYIEVTYEKNQKEVTEKVSKYTDTILIKGLINAEEFSFSLRSVNETPDAISKGNIITTAAVRPIRREPEITYYPDRLEEIPVNSENVIETFTQEYWEGPKENLVDNDINTYWHSAWSSGVEPLPHWIVLDFEESVELGAFSYWFRQNNGDVAGRPSKWAIEVSADGQNWERIWESRSNLPVQDASSENLLTLDKNYNSQFFKFLILENGGKTYTHLGEIKFFKMDSSIVDKEEEAEEEYYNF